MDHLDKCALSGLVIELKSFMPFNSYQLSDMNEGGNGGGSDINEGGGGGTGWATSRDEAYPEQFELECRLLSPTSGMGGSGEPWTCLGIVSQISKTKNLWVHRKK